MRRILKAISFLLLVMLLARCSSEKKIDKLADTLQIFNVILTSRGFLAEIPPIIDTVYFVKSKYISNRWPLNVNTLPIAYIPDTGSTRSYDLPWLDKHENDKRFRYGIHSFNIKGDSANVQINMYTFPKDCHYILVKTNDQWSIIKEWCGMN